MSLCKIDQSIIIEGDWIIALTNWTGKWKRVKEETPMNESLNKNVKDSFFKHEKNASAANPFVGSS